MLRFVVIALAKKIAHGEGAAFNQDHTRQTGWLYSRCNGFGCQVLNPLPGLCGMAAGCILLQVFIAVLYVAVFEHVPQVVVGLAADHVGFGLPGLALAQGFPVIGGLLVALALSGGLLVGYFIFGFGHQGGQIGAVGGIGEFQPFLPAVKSRLIIAPVISGLAGIAFFAAETGLGWGYGGKQEQEDKKTHGVDL